MEDFFAFDHANFALKGLRRFHAPHYVSLPDNTGFHDFFQLLFNFIAIGCISAVLGEVFCKGICPCLTTTPLPIFSIVFSTSFDNFPDVAEVLFCPHVEEVLSFANI